MATASSASATCGASRSASEKTATVGSPTSRHARTIRTAISPRLAMRSLVSRFIPLLSPRREPAPVRATIFLAHNRPHPDAPATQSVPQRDLRGRQSQSHRATGADPVHLHRRIQRSMFSLFWTPLSPLSPFPGRGRAGAVFSGAERTRRRRGVGSSAEESVRSLRPRVARSWPSPPSGESGFCTSPVLSDLLSLPALSPAILSELWSPPVSVLVSDPPSLRALGGAVLSREELFSSTRCGGWTSRLGVWSGVI